MSDSPDKSLVQKKKTGQNLNPRGASLTEEPRFQNSEYVLMFPRTSECFIINFGYKVAFTFCYFATPVNGIIQCFIEAVAVTIVPNFLFSSC